MERAVEHTVENYAFKSEQRTAQDGLSAKYAEASGQAADPSKRLHQGFAEATEPLAGIVGHAQAAVVAFVLVSAATIVSDVASIGFIDRALGGGFQSDVELDNQATAVDALTQYAAIAYLIVFAWSAIVIGRWTYRAMKNLRTMGYETTVSPGWAVGWHFVPIALLWMPFRGMAQIWRGSVHGAPLGEAKLPSTFRIWWACWLFGNWLSFGAIRTQESGLATENFELVQAALVTGIIGAGLHIVSALLLLGLMKKVSRAQSDQPAMQFS